MTPVVHITVDPSPTEKEIVHRPHWIHPQLKESVDPVKGRQLHVAGLIPKGTCLLVDRAYAMIPVVDEPAISDSLVCSNTSCHRRTARHARLACGKCIPDVVWCDSACRDADTIRHGFECTWLQRFAASLRAKRGEYDFGVLWLIVRLFAMRHVERQSPRPRQNSDVVKPVMASPLNSHQWKCGWEGIESLCGSSDTWSHEQVRAWSVLVKKYLASTPVLPHGLSADRVLHVICQEEANSFGLYPRETGVVPDPPIGRGEQFAAAVYPTAAIANHSCIPNVHGSLNPYGSWRKTC